MSFPLKTAALIFSTLLAGCTRITPPGASSAPLADCGASELQDQSGRKVTGTSASDGMVGGVPVRSKGDVRIIAPGQALIQNYSADRLNIEIDAAGKLVRASCG
jgi:hypothetical protein